MRKGLKIIILNLYYLEYLRGGHLGLAVGTLGRGVEVLGVDNKGTGKTYLSRGFFIVVAVDFGNILRFVLVFLMLTLSR